MFRPPRRLSPHLPFGSGPSSREPIMITKYLKLTLAGLVFISAAGLPHVAEAKKEHHGHGDSGHERHWDNDDDDHKWRRQGHDRDDRDNVIIVIDSRDRDIIREYRWDDDFCPPGLVRKKHGCIPPGHAKKYRIGERLPDYVVYYPVEDDLRIRLSPLPVGYNYVRVDEDILLIGEAGKKVIDAVTLLSAVGN